MVEPERVHCLNSRDERRGRYVLYWMQASQRAETNHALEYAVERAVELRLPVIAAFGLTDHFPEANLRHYAFMLEGLRETRRTLTGRGIQMVVRLGSPDAVALELAHDAAILVADRGYLRVQKKWRRNVARKALCPVVQVESDVVVPVDIASNKEEYAAATLRPKILIQRERFLRPLKPMPVRVDSLDLRLGGIDIDDVDAILEKLDVGRAVGRTDAFAGGASEARRRLRTFIVEKLDSYAALSSDPGEEYISKLGPYLHFGQISPIDVALSVRRSRARQESKDDFLEQLIVRRELSMNFAHFNPRYDSFRSLPGWARATLRRHMQDRREYDYDFRTLESARTHDPYWNAAMREMLVTGFMHNYMRMYWGKKVLEWTRSPEIAFKRLLRLNNRYFLDGRDPNSYAGVSWCFGKHDRPWGERMVFGTVRYMNAKGLDRKFDMEAYVRRSEASGQTDALKGARR